MTESREQIDASQLLRKVVRSSSAIYADGNCNWKHAAAELGLEHHAVTHQLKQFTKRVELGAVMLSCFAETQILERTWRDLKMFLSKRLVAKLRADGHSQLHPNLQLLVRQWMWRKSIGSTTPLEFLDALESLL